MISEELVPVANFLGKVVAGQNVEAGQSFTDMMIDRINNALADIKVNVAQQMFAHDATIGEDIDDAEAEFDEDDVAYLTQEEYDELPEDEKNEWDKLPEEVEVEEEAELVKEYSRGLWQPPKDVNKSTGVAKTKKAAKPVVVKPAAPTKPTKGK
jgi:hypothetical protein